MTIETARTPDPDPGSPLHQRYPGINQPDQVPVNDAVWSRVHNGQHVVSSVGEALGTVRDLSPHTFVVETRQNVLTTRELYVPHVAVSGVHDDTVHLGWSKEELIDTYEHYRRYHFGQAKGV
ncbi:MAG: hypothetical protein AB7R89_16645 [Dehalococcoidia bacterium]